MVARTAGIDRNDGITSLSPYVLLDRVRETRIATSYLVDFRVVHDTSRLVGIASVVVVVVVVGVVWTGARQTRLAATR